MRYNKVTNKTNTVRLRGILIFFGFTLLPIFAWFFWTWNQGETISQSLESFGILGDSIKESVSSLPTIAPVKADSGYTIEDEGQNAIKISYANETANSQQLTNNNQQEAQKLSLSFPKDIGSQPLSVNLPDNKAFTITSQSLGKDYTSSIISGDPMSNLDASRPSGEKAFFFTLFPKKPEAKYIKYESDDGRKIIYYAYQSDGTTGAKTLKHWTIYKGGDGNEKETYAFDKALLRKNEDGSVSVYYTDPNQLKNQEGAAGVDGNLLERAQRVLAQDAAENLDGREADAIIPSPYVLDKDGNKHDLTWVVSDDKKTLSVIIDASSFAQKLSSSTAPSSLYPLALDPTLSFTAPAISNTGDTITGEASSQFGYVMTTGDFNNDGKIDLVVGAPNAAGGNGRVYIFYNDGQYSVDVSGADFVIAGTTGFGYVLFAGDFNADGKTDLAISSVSSGYSIPGNVRIFYNDGSMPTSQSNADVLITGQANSDGFGASYGVGDFNADGKSDLVVSANGYNPGGAVFTGRVFVFYADGTNNFGTATCTGSAPTACLAADADAIITGEAANDSFGYAIVSGDFNSDGKIDLVTSGYGSSNRVYIFYNGSITTENAAGADIIIGGGGRFGQAMTTGDFNADGKVDLAVGAPVDISYTGRVFIFYNDGSIPTVAGSADVIITGAGDYFGNGLTAGDFNSDGRTDLVVATPGYATWAGRVSIYYNDGSIPTTAATADVIITGETANGYFAYGSALIVAGDLNSDGKTDLAVGAYGYASNRGKAYVFYSQNGQVNTNQSITGGATSDLFGIDMATGDFNADGRTDLVVGARGYNPGGAADTGRAYIFYGDGQIPSAANSADVVIVGEATNNYFGDSFVSGDFNNDGKTDLAIGAQQYSSYTGRTYIFYNDGSIPTTAAGADIIITGTGSSGFGSALATADVNTDGKTDLIVGAHNVSGGNGATYIFYSGSIVTEGSAGADVTIAAEASFSYFGSALTTGDFNADGRIDLAVGGYVYPATTYVGRVYIFYNDGSIPTAAGSADVIISGEAAGGNFGISIASGDFNSDGRTDLSIGANAVTSNGRVYIFYNDGSIPTTAATADVIIVGDGTNQIGDTLVAGDFNADGRTDLTSGRTIASSSLGQVYIFYNDGTIPTTSATADVTIKGTSSGGLLGGSLTTGDMNGDGRIDLIVGASATNTSTGTVYFYETRENFAWQLEKVSGTAASGGLRVKPDVTGQELSITGEASSSFGNTMATGDFNADGRVDLVVGTINGPNNGRVYIFYNDSSLPSSASSADVIITGEALGDELSTSIYGADLNTDGKLDLVVGAPSYSSSKGRVYVFYNDGAYPADAALADVIITGEATGNKFGFSLAVGDFNADGKTDFAAGANAYSTSTGRAYIFYNDGSIPVTAATADVIISGEAGAYKFGNALTSGDFNADGKTDIVVGAYFYSSSSGRAYVFYADGTNNFGTAACTGSAPTACLAANGDAIITGSASSNYFGCSFATGDFNADGKIDLVVGAYRYSSYTGRAYIFYNGLIITETAAGADITITGEGSGYTDFGYSLVTGDFNSDGRMDLAVGANDMDYAYIGRAYILYNDGSLPTTAATADIILTGTSSSFFGSSLISGDFILDGKTDLAVGGSNKVYIYTLNDTVITGGATGDRFGYAMTSGDFNSDGKIDLAVGAPWYSSSIGRVYIFYQDGIFPSAVAPADVTITGEVADSGRFGSFFATGDLNADGRMDLVVGAPNASSLSGRVYVFYNDGSIPTTGETADAIIRAESAGNYLGTALATGDFNADGKTDLVATAPGNSSDIGRAYIFYNGAITTENASGADLIIHNNTGSHGFGGALATIDINADGKADLTVSGTGNGYYSESDHVYFFYNDGSIPTTVSAADYTITGEATNDTFGAPFATGDLNADGKIDLVVGAKTYSSSRGRAYVFYNDGSLPTTAATADMILTGENAGDEFCGMGVATGDVNADGRTDLLIGGYSATATASKLYTFYNDGSYPTTPSTADVIVTGDQWGGYGSAFTTGDFNSDGKIDIAVGDYAYFSSTGRVYLIMSEAAVETTPNVTKVRGTIKVKGTVKIR